MKPPDRKPPEYLTPEMVEDEFSIPRQTLANDRWRGRGLPYTKRGRRILYARGDIERSLTEAKVQPASMVL